MKDEQGELLAAIQKLDQSVGRFLASGNRNTTNVRLEGAGSVWGAVAVGIALGASIACAAWVAGTLGDLADDQRNDDAFIQATYQAAPMIRDEFNRIKQEKANVHDPDSYSPATSAASSSSRGRVRSDDPTAEPSTAASE